VNTWLFPRFSGDATRRLSLLDLFPPSQPRHSRTMETLEPFPSPPFFFAFPNRAEKQHLNTVPALPPPIPFFGPSKPPWIYAASPLLTSLIATKPRLFHLLFRHSPRASLRPQGSLSTRSSWNPPRNETFFFRLCLERCLRLLWLLRLSSNNQHLLKLPPPRNQPPLPPSELRTSSPEHSPLDFDYFLHRKSSLITSLTHLSPHLLALSSGL